MWSMPRAPDLIKMISDSNLIATIDYTYSRVQSKMNPQNIEKTGLLTSTGAAPTTELPHQKTRKKST